MKPRRNANKKLTTARDAQKKHIIRGVVKRGTKPQLKAAKRNAWRVIKGLFKVSLIAAVCYGGWYAYDRLFWRNPDYALSDVAFTTDGSLTREQALTVAQLKPGRNVYDYDLDAATAALEALPQVANAAISRYLPNRIEVTVSERKPVAWVVNDVKDERTHLLDARGLVFKPKRLLTEYDPLPVISGVELGDLAPGKPIRKSELVAALQLLRLSRETNETQVLSIDVSKGYCLVATDQRHSRVTFGLDEIGDQLRRLALYRQDASNSIPPQEIETINLMVQYNVPVTFVPPPEPEPLEEAAVAEPPPPRVKAAEPSKSTKPAPAKKAEPKTKDAPKRDGVTKQFRRTA
jgi:cell division septal protein FtsQ